MTLSNPTALWGLLSLPVVLALHLFRERRERYVVSNLEMWSFLEPEVRGSLPRRIPITWVLLLDLTIAALLTLGLARPQLKLTITTRAARHLILLIDISASMTADDVLPSRFYQARAKALALLSDLGPEDVVTVIGFGNGARWIGDNRFTEYQELVERVTALEAAELGSDLGSGLALALEAEAAELPIEIHILTDGALSAPPPDLEALPFANYALVWDLFGASIDNQAVFDLNVQSSAHGEVQAFFRVGNYGTHAANVLVNLLLDGVPVDSARLDIPADSVIPQVWTVKGNPASVTVSLLGDDPYRLDNTATTGMPAEKSVRLALVSDSPGLLKRALEILPAVDLRVLSPEEYLPGMNFDFVVFRGWLPDQLPSGSILVLDPPLGNTLFPVRGSETIDGPPIPTDHPVLDGVNFTGVRWGKAWVLESIPDGFRALLSGGDVSLLLEGHIGFSQVMLLLADLDNGGLPNHPAFPILLANMVNTLQRFHLPSQVQLGEEIPIPTANEFPLVQLTTPSGTQITWQSDRPSRWAGTFEPGLYQMELTDFEGRSHPFVIGANAAHIAESDLRIMEGLQNFQRTEGEMVGQRQGQVNLTPWLLGLSVVFLVLEAWLAWR